MTPSQINCLEVQTKFLTPQLIVNPIFMLYNIIQLAPPQFAVYPEEPDWLEFSGLLPIIA